jgi:hypothetical protein
MAARPLGTFQSEGYYNTGRANHYFRPSPEGKDLALTSLCGRYSLGEGLRPHLLPTPKASQKVCQPCNRIWLENIMRPEGSQWFEDPA